METQSPPPDSDAELRRIGEVSLRMMANAISKSTHDKVRALLSDSGDEYPWQRVVDTVLAEPAPAEELLPRGLRAQRDWFARTATSSATRAARSARLAGKTALAYVLSRLLFFVLYTVAVVALLVLLKQRWPDCDVYRILEWLRDVLPGVFRR